VTRPRGVALAIVLAALVVAGALAAGAVMAASQGMRDATGAVARAAVLARAEGALALAITSPEWDSAWTAPGPPGLVAVRPHGSGAITDSVMVVRLTDESFLLLVEAAAAGPPSLSARARLSLLVVLDAARHPVHAGGHAWSPMP
jgi:type II secretory pathway component PulK